MNITIVGTGYVGLVTGTCFAELGSQVTCIDTDVDKIHNLNNGILPIYEPGLEALINKNVNAGRLNFQTKLEDVLHDSDIIFIAVGTPPDQDGSADLTYVLDVAKTIGENISRYVVVAVKSTVPVGTTYRVKNMINEQLKTRGENINFDVVSNPEFLKEGDAINDFMKPDRVVIGIESKMAEDLMTRLYKPIQRNNFRVIYMDINSAEMTKYAANSMLATRISFMNEIANLCELLGADVNMVRKGIGSDSRIGNKFLYPGVGYGGSCFPKDVKALISTAAQRGYNLKILNAVEEVNNNQKNIPFNKFNEHYNGEIKGKKVAIWGLSFKPGTDDMREAPSLVLINQLLNAKCQISVYDPVAMDEAKKRLGGTVKYARDLYDAVLDTEVIFHITEWNEFRIPNWEVIRRSMRPNPVIIDGRNVFGNEVSSYFKYICIGVNK